MALMGPVAWMTLMYLARLEATLQPSVEQILDTTVKSKCEMKTTLFNFSVCRVWNRCHRHHHGDQHLQERRPHNSKDIQHPAQTDFMHSNTQVRAANHDLEIIPKVFFQSPH